MKNLTQENNMRNSLLVNKKWLMLILYSCLITTAVDSVLAEELRVVKNPPLLKKNKKIQSFLLSPNAVQPIDHEAALDLNIVYTMGELLNPATGLKDWVKLRSYQGTDIDPVVPFISPMIDLTPGDTLRINLHNKLPTEASCTQPPGNINDPHCFNGTNLHTHGLWVNPAGNSDNVLLTINPGVSFEYEYNIPADHPAGTFWYHTHNHGSTALQVSSGMAGALIVRGNRLPTLTDKGDIKTGDIDTLLKSTAAQPFKERVLVMQQIQYACRDTTTGKIQYVDNDADKGVYLCKKGDTGGIEGYDQFSPGTWPKSGRYTSINGLVLPTFTDVKAGQVERWRLIHGGVRDSINLQFRKMSDSAKIATLLKTSNNETWIEKNCPGKPLPYHLIAADGLTSGKIIKTEQTTFQPAYRWDALMVFPEKGRYCVIDAAAPASANLDQAAPSQQLLAYVDADGSNIPDSDITHYLTQQLISAAKVNMPAPVQEKVIADLQEGKLNSFVPHPDIQETEVTGTQELVFNIDIKNKPTQFQIGNKLNVDHAVCDRDPNNPGKVIDPKICPVPFDPKRIDRVLKLGGVDEWTLQSEFVDHPFHIHVNPFQVVKILDPEGRDVSDASNKDDRGGCSAIDLEYGNLKGVWKDTLWVKNAGTKVPADASPECQKRLSVSGKYTLVVRTRYQRYIGDYVLHCHILDHEDQGMMQIVRVALPDGAGGTSEGHHH